MKRNKLSDPFANSNVGLESAVEVRGWQVVDPNSTALKQIDIGGSQLTYIGRGKGPLVVFVHGAHTLGPMLKTYFEPTELDRSRALKLTTPTLLITGEHSPSIYRAITRELNDCLPASESFILPGASHGLHLESPEDFGVAVLEFLSNN